VETQRDLGVHCAGVLPLLLGDILDKSLTTSEFCFFMGRVGK
jgi:hypothetical protein